MEKNGTVSLLYQVTLDYKMTEFYALCEKAWPDLPPEERLDAYLLRAQVKLRVADISAAEDLQSAGALGGTPALPCLLARWVPDSPNGFVVFPAEPNALADFLAALPQMAAQLAAWFGDEATRFASVIRGEILYFTGRCEEAIQIAEQQPEPNRILYLMAGYVIVRSSLALGDLKRLEEKLLEIIRIASSHLDDPHYQGVYRIIRDWINFTTGWSGDMPRYHHSPDGVVLPVLEDRTAAILKGISQLTDTERPFADYARLAYADACTMRRFYMDAFRAMEFFRTGQHREARALFDEVYTVARASGVIMPLVEYGRQIVPFLRQLAGEDNAYDAEWLRGIIASSEEYEEHILAYRDE